jgi:hypothetical protein
MSALRINFVILALNYVLPICNFDSLQETKRLDNAKFSDRGN